MNLADRMESYYSKANQRAGGRLDILRHALNSFEKLYGSQAAAGMAYYVFFSLFPLLLVFVSVGSYFLERGLVYDEVINMVNRAIPVGYTLIDQNLQSVLSQRGTIGIIGLVTLLWSASGMFTMLAHNINLAWSDARRRKFFERRLVGLAMIASIGLLILLSFAADTAFKVVTSLNVPILEKVSIYETSLWSILSYLTPWLLIFFLFLALYWGVPATKVKWRAALWSAAIAAFAWQIATNAFSFYVSSGMGRYDIVYGSLGAVVVLIFLIYILSWITLFGAHLCASIDHWLKMKDARENI
jgi:YihY family inner membrane protein